MARALLFQAHLPLSFWGECVLTVAYIINKLPALLLKGKSPHEMLFQKPPFFTQLLIFGCLCFARNPHVTNKFDQRGTPGVFVGYPYGQKGYRVFDFQSKKIFTSRDVIFHEHIFPFKNISSTHSHMPIHTLPIHDDGTFNFLPPTSSIPHESTPHEDTISSATFLDNEMTPDAPPVSNSLHPSTSAQPIPPIRSVWSRQPPSYLKKYHCSTLPHVANLVQSDSMVTKVSTSYPMALYVSDSNFSLSHKGFCPRFVLQLNLSPFPKPSNTHIGEQQWPLKLRH